MQLQKQYFWFYFQQAPLWQSQGKPRLRLLIFIDQYLQQFLKKKSVYLFHLYYFSYFWYIMSFLLPADRQTFLIVWVAGHSICHQQGS